MKILTKEGLVYFYNKIKDLLDKKVTVKNGNSKDIKFEDGETLQKKYEENSFIEWNK